jgi:hypothetical protein
MNKCVVALLALCFAIAVIPAIAGAHGDEAGEQYVSWTGSLGGSRSLGWLEQPAQPPAAPGISGLELIGNADKDGTINSDMAFWGNLVYAGNWSGFRIIDVSLNSPRVLVDFACNGPQGDVSVYEMGGRRFLFESVDTPQTAPDCSSVNAPIFDDGRVGYEGVRVFDVTDPLKPKFLEMIQTACGSHTHTLVPQGDKAYLYVGSYPFGLGVSPPGSEGPGAWRPCTVPHQKISVIEVSAPRGKFSSRLREQRLSDDTDDSAGFQACHDFQAFMKRHIMLAACAGDAQLWDISDPWRPTANVEGEHTHIRSPEGAEKFEFIHSGVFSWDGKSFAVMDEVGGSVEPECDGPGTKDGFYYFYKLVRPGDPAPKLQARYTIPRSQSPEICVPHNANVIPVKGANVMVIAFNQGGLSVVDFTDLQHPKELAWADLEDEIGAADTWSAYWYNGRIFANDGIARRGDTANRGLDVFKFTPALHNVARAEQWSHANPQTQEAWQAP